MPELFTECTRCTHYEPKEGLSFYCKLHDITYNTNQESCEDLEDKADYESTAFECD